MFGDIFILIPIQIEFVMRYAFFWGITQRLVIVPYRLLGQLIGATFKGKNIQEKSRSHSGTWLRNYHCATQCNISEVRMSYPSRGGSLKSRLSHVFGRSVL